MTWSRWSKVRIQGRCNRGSRAGKRSLETPCRSTVSSIDSKGRGPLLPPVAALLLAAEEAPRIGAPRTEPAVGTSVCLPCPALPGTVEETPLCDLEANPFFRYELLFLRRHSVSSRGSRGDDRPKFSLPEAQPKGPASPALWSQRPYFNRPSAWDQLICLKKVSI
jgi:hypothetical protein